MSSLCPYSTLWCATNMIRCDHDHLILRYSRQSFFHCLISYRIIYSGSYSLCPLNVAPIYHLGWQPWRVSALYLLSQMWVLAWYCHTHRASHVWRGKATHWISSRSGDVSLTAPQWETHTLSYLLFTFSYFHKAYFVTYNKIIKIRSSTEASNTEKVG